MANELIPLDGVNTLDGLLKLVDQLQKADGFVPKHMLGQPGKILACMLTGRELGVGPMASLRAFWSVEGSIVASYSFWIARLKAHGYRVEWRDCGPETATLVLTAPDGSQHVETWDRKRAERAGLWGKRTWANYQETMLKARCVTSAGRTFAAEVMFGCYETDEAEEMRTVEATVTNAPQGVAGLAAKLGVQAEPAAVSQPAAKVQPFDLVEEAIAAIHNAGRDTLRTVMERAKASNFTGEDAKAIVEAKEARVADLTAEVGEQRPVGSDA